MKMGQKSRLITYVLIIWPLILITCVYDTTDPYHYDEIYKKEFEFCKAFLDRYFYFRDSLPENPDTFSTLKNLYASVNDPFTEYIDISEIEDFLHYLRAKSETGLGIEIDSVAIGVVVSYVYPNSPGEQKQLQCGDTLVAVNDKSLSGINMITVKYYLGQTSGTTKIVQIKRDSIWQDTIELSEYFIPPVYVDSINEEIAYIYLAGFLDSTGVSGGTYSEINDALIKTQWAIYTILDLRDNLGGTFNQCIQVASKFMPVQTEIIKTKEWVADTIVSTGGFIKDSTWIDADTTNFGDREFYLLINDSTAGATEILVSCLQKNSIANKIFGSKSYGLGLKQILTSTPNSMVAKVTFSEIFSITGESYNGMGINPDEPVTDEEDGLEKILEEIIGGELSQYMTVINRINAIREKHRTTNHNKPLCITWAE